jgi:MYXO-CTERM domain-containing protein
MTELLELALAYNFVTPYTAFLAIPESELGDQRGTIEAARAAKKKIMANNPDAANLEKTAPGGTYITADATKNLPAPGRSFSASMDADGADDEDAPTEKSAGEYATVQSTRGRGCAGCASGADPSSMVLLLGLVGLMLRRRRR